MTKRILVAAGLAAALTGGTAIALAQQPAGPDGPGMRDRVMQGARGQQRGPRARGPRMDLGLRGVELTEAQRDQMRSIMESHRAELTKVGQALRDARRAFAEASRAAVVDEAAIRQRSTALADAMADEAVLRARVRTEVHGLLTTEQQQQLKDRQAAMQKRMQERQERQKQRQQQRQQRPPL